MKKIWTVCKNELKRYFISPLAYVYLISFLLLNASFAIYFGDFFNRGQADLLSMFTFLPWLYLLFVSGIASRLWAEEFHNKTIVQIATMPIDISSLVLGKFFAAWLFCGLALILTFPLWLSVNILGNPDNMVILLGYIGGFMLSGCMLAVAQTVSALTKSQVIAVVLAVIANLFFFWSGVEYILSFFRLFLNDTFVDTIASFSFLRHFNTLSKGLFGLNNLIFFISLIAFCNYTTTLIVNFKTAGTSGWLKSTDKTYTVCAWIMLLLGFFGVNILANNLTKDKQLDFTQEKLYTLSENTVKILQSLPEPVVAKLYFSPVLEKRNSLLREKFDNIRILLQKYKAASNGNFEYKVYYPKFLSTQEDVALANGVQAIPLIDLNQNALFGLTLEDSLQNKAVIPYFAQNNFGSLEQDISSKIYQLELRKKNIGIFTNLSIFGSSGDDGIINSPWEIVRVLEENYNVIRLKNEQDFADNNFDVLILLYPQNLSPKIIEAIKKYSQNNGKIIVLLDPANEASRSYTITTGALKSSDLGELEQFWHIKLYPQYVVADLKNSITVDATVDYNTNPTFTQDVIQFRLGKDDMNPFHPITSSLHEIMLASASVVMPEKEAYEQGKIEFTPLLKASDISSVMTSDVVIDGLNPQEILEYFRADNNQKIIAAEVIGKTKDNPFDLIVINDSDFLYDSFWMNKEILLENEYVRNIFDNANLLLNAIDYLSGDNTLIALRGKRATIRRFDDIEILRRINSLNYKQQEMALFAKTDKAKQALQEVWSKKNFEERENFTPDELAAISKIRGELDKARQELSDLRYQAFKDIKSIADKIAVFNIATIPATILLILLVCTLWRKRKNLSLPHIIRADKKLFQLSAVCLLLLAVGCISAHLTNLSSIDNYENKLVFPQLANRLNDVQKIELKNHEQTLTFVKKENMWILSEFDKLPLYQERIRHLLTTLANASYFARKSNKAENLAMFNLLPIEDEKSRAVKVSLYSDTGLLETFNLGDINIDIGRGAKAAYINFENQFQVWEISADFIDMDLDWHKWTYSNLWDLRYGRIDGSKSLQTNAEDKYAHIMKLLLNTPIIDVAEIKLTEPIHILSFFIEDGNYVDIYFYKQGDKAYALYKFNLPKQNHHLDLLQKYLQNKAVEIDAEKMEKIIELSRK